MLLSLILLRAIHLQCTTREQLLSAVIAVSNVIKRLKWVKSSSFSILHMKIRVIILCLACIADEFHSVLRRNDRKHALTVMCVLSNKFTENCIFILLIFHLHIIALQSLDKLYITENINQSVITDTSQDLWIYTSSSLPADDPIKMISMMMVQFRDCLHYHTSLVECLTNIIDVKVKKISSGGVVTPQQEFGVCMSQ